jgi:maltodextrin utilization protein YvdJ
MGFFSKKKNIIACAPLADEKKTMKFLTQDGQLVEVDISKINSLKEKASNKEMQQWVKR